jgi:hypothetical protein
VDRPHDLVLLIQQATADMAAEYKRIRMRTREDSGTAGDQGEENWADLLRAWLPASYPVVTKGRVLFTNGEPSDQLDVLVLSPSYPRGLLNKKHYLAAGVIAAFECKNTLRREHIKEAVQSSAKLGSLSRNERSIRHHIVSGLLAHSHNIASKRRPPQEVISDALAQADQSEVSDPRDCLDLICVADLGTWALMRFPIAPTQDASAAAVATCYMGQVIPQVGQAHRADLFPDPIGRFLTSLLGRFAPVDPALGSIASYFFDTQLYGTGHGQVRQWELVETSEDIQRIIMW